VGDALLADAQRLFFLERVGLGAADVLLHRHADHLFSGATI
jgi:hypothetical protein